MKSSMETTFQITEIEDRSDEENKHSREYLVEEPDNFDYIFEPGHYPEPQTVTHINEETESSSKPNTDFISDEKYKNGVKYLKR